MPEAQDVLALTCPRISSTDVNEVTGNMCIASPAHHA
jgi:hypothetical protein